MYVCMYVCMSSDMHEYVCTKPKFHYSNGIHYFQNSIPSKIPYFLVFRILESLEMWNSVLSGIPDFCKFRKSIISVMELHHCNRIL